MSGSITRRIWKSLLGKVALMVFAFGVFYIVADPFGWVPDSVKGLVLWFSGNFTTMVYALCFLAACYVFVQFINRNKRKAIQ